MFAPAYEAGRNDRAFDRLNGTDRQMLADIQVDCTDFHVGNTRDLRFYFLRMLPF